MHKRVLLVAMMAIANAGSAKAQEADASVRERCEARVRALETTNFDVRSKGPIDRIDRCDRTAPPFLARMWVRRLTAEQAQRLMYASAQFRDGRILTAALQAAEDHHLSAVQRIAALQTAALYVWPSLSFDTRWLAPEGAELLPIHSSANMSYRPGSVAPRPSEIASILQVLEVLDEDADQQVAFAASRLTPYVRRRLETN